MRHRRLTIFPLPERGHIYPTLEIARRYSARGVDVVYVTAPQFENVIRSVGARIEPVFPIQNAVQEPTGQQLWYQFCPNQRPGSRGKKITETLRDIAIRYPTDLFLLDYHLTLSFGCDPQNAIGSTPYTFFATSLLPWDEGRLGRLNGTTLVFCPSCLEVPKFRDRGAKIQYVEPSIFCRDAGEAVRTNIHSVDQPLVLATWGTQSMRYVKLSKMLMLLRNVALKLPNIRFLVASPFSVNSLFGDTSLPPNFTIERDLPQLALLESASLFVTHGGLNSLKEAILHKVPTLVLPFVKDQPYNAIRVERSGIGAALFPEEQDLLSLEGMILTLLSRDHNNQLSAMQQRFLADEINKPSDAFLQPMLL